MIKPAISIIIPAHNEVANLIPLLPKIKAIANTEIVIVDDGSTDDTKKVCEHFNVNCVSHPYNKGNGAAVKTGARHAKGKIFIFMDADGQHDPDDIPRLLATLDQGYDMVVGARSNRTQASLHRYLANRFYNILSSLLVGHPIRDLTSGFRAVRANKFKEFIHLLPNGFSYPSTITMAFFRAGYSVNYMQVDAGKRTGKSHIHAIRDGIRFLLIIYKISTLYSPLKVFMPMALLNFIIGCIFYIYNFSDSDLSITLTAVFFTTSFIIFLIGLVSEQITMLMYQQRDADHDED